MFSQTNQAHGSHHSCYIRECFTRGYIAFSPPNLLNQRYGTLPSWMFSFSGSQSKQLAPLKNHVFLHLSFHLDSFSLLGCYTGRTGRAWENRKRIHHMHGVSTVSLLVSILCERRNKNIPIKAQGSIFL